jgi:deoxyguanosine kinase
VRSVRPRYIAVEGPIGVGKSSLAHILGETLSARVILDERPQENPFLGAFYKDRRRHAMSTQLFFLLQRYAQQGELAQGDLFSRNIVTDYIFAKDRLFALLNLSADEMALYDRIYQMLRLRTVTPDLVVYLQARTDVLMDRIHGRGRAEEKPIRAEYVQELAASYADYFFSYKEGPLLIVNANDIDFVGNPEHRRELLEVIEKAPAGTSHWSRG